MSISGDTAVVGASADDGPGEVQPTGLSFAGELAALRARLVRVIGPDADLVLAVLVLDADQREAAALLGLGHEAARKRFQRALHRLRAHLKIASASEMVLPQSAG